MGKEIKGFCPNCKNVLYYEEGDNAVLCNCCDCTVVPESASSGAPSSAMGGAVAMPAPAISFDNAESAIVYLESFFENYDWNEYCRSTAYILEELEEIVVKNKSENGSNAFVWELDFKSVCVPVNKKLAALADYAKEIGNKYDPVDSADAFEVFDLYRKVINGLDRRKDEIFKRLETDIKYAERFNLDSAALTAMKADFNALKKAFEASVKHVNKINEVSAYVAAKKKLDEAKKLQLREAFGIEAEEVYNSAVEAYNADGFNKNRALSLFEKIRGYSDTNEYIDKINMYFNYHSELFSFCGKTFVFRKLKPVLFPAFNVDKPEEDPASEAEAAPETLSLLEVVDGKVSELPVIQGIEWMLTCYGTHLYYFKKAPESAIANLKKGCGKKKDQNNDQPVEERVGIYCYDFANNSEICIDQAPKSQYTLNGQYCIRTNAEENQLLVKKKLEVSFDEKRGCKDKLLRKAPGIPVEANNYCLVSIDMATNESTVIIDAMVDVAERYGDSLFFIKADAPVKAFVKPGEEAPKPVTHLMLYNLKTGEISSVLSERCELHDVTDGKVIYTVWAPNEYNIDLRVYDLKTGVDTLIEANIYDYALAKNGKIFYYVGNHEYTSLMSNSYAGTDRVEIMQRASWVERQVGNWIYIRKGDGKYNKVIIKYRLDGKKSIRLATQFKEFVHISEDSVFYLDAWNSLHIVRPDGKEDRIIAQNIEKKDIILAEDKIFYVRGEYVGDERVSNSLYAMDMLGHNIQKLVFDIDKIKDYDETKLYYSRRNNMRYRVTIPAAKDKDVQVYYETHQLHKFYEYNKATGESTVVLTLGEPHGNTTFKKGCLKKEVTADIIYTEEPIVKAYKRTNVAKAGENTKKAVATSNVAAMKNASFTDKLKFIGNEYKKGCTNFINSLTKKK